MEILKKSEVYKIIHKELDGFLAGYSFKPVKNEQRFLRELDYGSNKIAPALASYGSVGHQIRFIFTTNHKELSNYMTRFEKAYSNDDTQLSGSAVFIQDDYNKDFPHYKVKYPEHVMASVEDFKKKFVEFGLPFYERFSSIQEMEAECNNEGPYLTGKHFPERVFKGLCLAKMVGRKDIEKVADWYRNKLREMYPETELVEDFRRIDALLAYEE